MSDGLYALPFGKHRGVPIGKVPSDYLKFLLGWDKLKGATHDKIVQELNRRAGKEPSAAPKLTERHGELGHDMLKAGFQAVSKEVGKADHQMLLEVFDRLAAGIEKITGVSSEEAYKD